MAARRGLARSGGLVAAALLALAGCAGEEPAGLAGETPRPRVSTTSDPSTAICEGDYGHAWKLAADGLSTDRSNPRLAILAAYALEQMGRPVQARMVYRQLVAADDPTRVLLVCGDSTPFDGRASDVANLRQRAVERTLASLGVLVDRLDPVPEPPPAPPPVPAPVAAAPEPPPVAAAPEKKGRRYLSHMESYRTRAAVDVGWSRLKARHEAELGGFAPHVEKIDLGPGKGEFLRLGVVFPARKDAKALCEMLGKTQQYCSVERTK